MRTTLVAILLTFGWASSLPAQRIEGSPFPSIGDTSDGAQPLAIPEPAPNQVDESWLIGGGLLGGAAAGFAGMYSGAMLLEDDCEDCAIIGGVYGLVAGVSSGIPLGVHLSNRGRGNLLPSLLSSLAIGGVGLGVAIAADEPAVMLGVPVLQLASAILIERKTGREGH